MLRKANSPAIIISASDSKSRPPGAPLKKMFTSPTMGRVSISLVASSPSDVLARMINVNSKRRISRNLGVAVDQNKERAYCLRPASIYLQVVDDHGREINVTTKIYL